MVGDEEGKDAALLHTPDMNRLVVGVHLERTKNPKLHHPIIRHPPEGSSLSPPISAVVSGGERNTVGESCVSH